MNTKMGNKDITQAVVLADDFTTNLIPANDTYPSVLMPVINIPLLDYLLETLIKSRVQELFLYCSSHIDLLKAYVKGKKCSRISISLIVSDGCRSLGDALRDIDTKGLIRGFFILIRGDAFINADLKDILSIHRTKFEKDKGATMSMLLRNCGCINASSLKDETSLLVSERTTKKLLYYQKINNDQKKVKLELSWFLDHSEIQINTCFMDTHVYMCSPTLLPLFSDNFDFQTMEDFVRGVLMNEELLDTRIYWQQLSGEDYSLPIVSWKAYHTLSRDILQRHSFPLTPNAIPTLKNFIHMPRSIYKHKTATLAKGCILEEDSILSEGSMLGNNTSVTRSVIGKNCTIGSNVTITNSYILSNVNIQDNCTIKNCVVFSNSSTGKNTDLSRCILYPNTNIGTSTNYNDCILKSEGTNISITKMSDVDNDTGFQFFKMSDVIECDDYSTDVSTSDESSECNSPIPDDTNMFLSEVIDSLLRGYQDKLKCENLILEINSSRYAYNVSMREVTYNVIKAILSLPFHYLSEIKETVTNQNYQKNLKAIVTYFHSIILNYVKNDDGQDDCLRAIEEVASTTQELLPFLQHLLHFLYERNILSEERIFKWYQSNDADANEFHSQKVRKSVQLFVKWLMEAEEGSTESDDD